jgi:toxin ParE1/3/4
MIFPGLRTIPFKHSATILYRVEDARVEIVGIFSRGQNWESRFRR